MEIRDFLDGVCAFLEGFLTILNTNSVNFFTHDMWEQCLCLTHGQIAKELVELSDADLAKFPTGNIASDIHNRDKKTDFSSLQIFIAQMMKNRMDAFLSSSQDDHSQCHPHRSFQSERSASLRCLLREFETKRREETLSPTVEASSESYPQRAATTRVRKELTKRIMGKKKSHEVDIMAQLCSRLSAETRLNQVLDVGSGKGYLGQFLSKQYNLPVISVDSSDVNTEGASKRSERLTKQWTGIVHDTARKVLHSGRQKAVLAGENVKTSVPSKPCQQTLSCSPSRGDTQVRTLDVAAGNTFETEVIDYQRSPSDGRKTEAITSDCKIGVRSETSHKSMSNTISPAHSTCTSDASSTAASCSPAAKAALSSSKQPDMQCVPSTDSVPENPCATTEVCNSTGPTLDRIRAQEQTTWGNRAGGREQGQVSHDQQSPDHQSHDQQSPDNHSPAVFLPVTGYVDEGTRLSDFLRPSDQEEYFNESEPFMMVGLHTCGNLAPSMLRIFTANPCMQCVCAVGCCYHLVTEEFARQDEWDREQPGVKQGSACGFPMSLYLTGKQAVLGRGARMAACLSAERVASEGSVDVRGLFFRAVFQVICKDHYAIPTRKQSIGKLAAKCQSFLEYTRRALRKLKMDDTKLSDEEIESYEARYRARYRHLVAYNQLRAALAPSIETLILLDRLLYLQEQPIVKEAEILRLFDPVVSPRCYAIVALKETNTAC